MAAINADEDKQNNTMVTTKPGCTLVETKYVELIRKLSIKQKKEKRMRRRRYTEQLLHASVI